MEEDTGPSRRDYLEAVAATGTAALSGCLFGPEAPEIQSQMENTEDLLRQELNWQEYALNYNVDSLNMGKQRLGETGVEGARTYGIATDIDLAGNSDDLEGWTATPERREEFFSLLNRTTYDILRLEVENLHQFHPRFQPSHRNQIVSYNIHVGADKCSYVEDTISVERIPNILNSRSAYEDYVNGGDAYNINLDDGRLGLGYFC